MPIIVEQIYTYPVKGLAGGALAAATLCEDGLANDRRFGIAYADPAGLLSGSDKWRPWDYFITLKKYPRAARLTATAYEDNDALILTLTPQNEAAFSRDVNDPRQRNELEEYIAAALDMPAIRLIDSGKKRLWDDQLPVSLVNRASVAALADGGLDPRRFRPNILFSGADAWQEEGWQGALTIGGATLSPAGNIPRCAATRVNPTTFERDANPPQTLYKTRGNSDLGIFATITRPGNIAAGAEIKVESPR